MGAKTRATGEDHWLLEDTAACGGKRRVLSLLVAAATPVSLLRCGHTSWRLAGPGDSPLPAQRARAGRTREGKERGISQASWGLGGDGRWEENYARSRGANVDLLDLFTGSAHRSVSQCCHGYFAKRII